MGVAKMKGAKGRAEEIHPLLKSGGNKPRTGKVKKCLVCEKEVYRSPSEIGRKYCSLSCYNEAQTQEPPRPCAICGKMFRTSPFQKAAGRKYCSPACYYKSKKPKAIGNRRTGLMSRTKILAQKYARLRDCGGYNGSANCISCYALKPYAELDGGHFIPSTCSYWKFDERNINAQCHKCNRFLHGNQRHYAKGMVRKYGHEVLDEIEKHEFDIKKWSYDELSMLYDYYSEQIGKFDEKEITT